MPKNKGERAHVMRLAPYPCELHTYHTKKGLYRAAKAFGAGSLDLETSLGMTVFQADEGRILMGVFTDAVPILAHEAIHAALACLKYVDIEPTSNGGECLTYLVQYIMESLMAPQPKESQ